MMLRHISFLSAVFAMEQALFAVAQSSSLPPSSLPVGPGVYNTSHTPSSLPWNTYNYCNGPHVNAAHYTLPNATGAQLVYMNMMMRHHKRTPDNLYPDELALNPASGWDCTNFVQMNYARGAAPVFHAVFAPPEHPFAAEIWHGTCDEGQLTAAGLADAVKHGQDFWGVYHDTVNFFDSVSEKEMWIRTSTEDRTQQVASGLLFGMDPSTENNTQGFTLHTQPDNIDSLVPNYGCPNADNIRNAYQSVPAWNDHLEQNQDLQNRLANMLGVEGMSAWLSWYDHFFDTFTSRTCHGHPLPCNASGTCVAQEDADRVFALGDFEYNYIWNTAQNASEYNSLTFGVMFAELAANFQSFAAGNETVKARLYVGHDGSLIRLSSGLGFGKTAPLRWPALGSEVVMEVWRVDEGDFVRVMHEGTPVDALSWVPYNDFVQLLLDQVPADIFDACGASIA